MTAVALPAGAQDAAQRRPGTTETVSVLDGELLGGTIQSPVISADGRVVAFESDSTQLAGDTNDAPDVFVHDRSTGRTVRASLSPQGHVGNSVSADPAVSGDGRFVAFTSLASDLIPGATNGSNGGIFVRDLQEETTEIVSVAMDGGAANGSASRPSISDDGRYVAFSSSGSNLAPGDTNTFTDVYVFDRHADTTEAASVNDAGEIGNLFSTAPDISGDGRFVVFQSLALNLDDITGADAGYDVFLRDRLEGTTRRLSLSPDGLAGNDNSYCPSISDDGSAVAFLSHASNLVPDDGNGFWDVFVRDLETGTTERINVEASGREGSGDGFFSCGPKISGDGRYVVFETAGAPLDGPTAGPQNAYLHDRVTGATELISVTSGGGPADGVSLNPDVNSNGRLVAFQSRAPNLGAGGDDGFRSVAFVRDRGPELGFGALDVSGDGTTVEVTGWTTFSGALVADASDAPDDVAPGAERSGLDLTGASIAYRPERSDLLLRLDLSRLPSVPGIVVPGASASLTPSYSAAPAITYGVSFVIGEESFAVAAVKHPDPPATVSLGLYRCDVVCERVSSLSGGYGTTGERIAVALPLVRAGLDEGDRITAVRAWTALGVPQTGDLLTVDSVDLGEVVIPEREVTISIGSDRVPVSLDSGAFSVRAPVPPAQSDIPVTGSVCLGTRCVEQQRTLALGPPTPTLPAPTDTTAPPPPQELLTALDFTVASKESGQYSDPTTWAARLTERESGESLAGRRLTFSLIGGSRTYEAVTDEDGVATVEPVIEEKPGSHQVTVRFEASEGLSSSADIAGFVVAREDTTTSLVIEGKGSKRRLAAQLIDRDSSQAIAGRTLAFASDDTDVGEAATGPDGWAHADLPPRERGGHHEYSARFAGDDYYEPSEAARNT